MPNSLLTTQQAPLASNRPVKTLANSADTYRPMAHGNAERSLERGTCNDYSRRGSRAKRLQVQRIQQWMKT